MCRNKVTKGDCPLVVIRETHVSGLYFGQEDEGELRGQCVLLHGLPFLPVPLVDGAYVGHRAQQGLVTAHQRLVTQAQPLVQPLPENLLIALGAPAGDEERKGGLCDARVPQAGVCAGREQLLKRRKVRLCLAAVLVAGHRRDDLGGDGAGHLEALGGLDELAPPKSSRRWPATSTAASP